MKSIAIVFLVVVVAAAQAAELSTLQRAATAAFRTGCRLTQGVSLAEEKVIHDGQFDNLSEKQKCFIKCMTDIVKFTDAQSNVNEKALHKLLDPLIGVEKANLVSAECNHLKGKNPCDTATVIFKCHASHDAVFLI